MVTHKKRTELDMVLHLLIQGLTKAKIREKLNLKPTALSYHLRRLEDLGSIERKGKFIINVLRSSVLHPKVTKNQVQLKLNKRGHAFNFKVIFPKEEDLLKKPKVIHELKLKNLKKLKFGSLKLVKDRCSIWINKGSLTIYSNNSYYSGNALHSKFRALKDLDNLIQDLKMRFGFSGMYGIEIFREHYGLILNKFAKWILKKKGKLYVREKGNKTILWVDNSRKDDIGLTEFEGGDPIRINKADGYFNSHEKTDWKVTPELTLKMFNEAGKLIKANAEQTKENSETIGYYGKNVVKHVGLIEKIDGRIEKMDKRDAKMNERDEKLLKAIQKLVNKKI